EVAHGTHHVEDAVELRPVARPAPGGAHAEARRPARLGLLRTAADFFDAHERLGLHRRLVAGALAAIRAILGTAAGLDAQQGAALHVAVAAVGPVHLGGAEHQFGQRQPVDAAEIVE